MYAGVSRELARPLFEKLDFKAFHEFPISKSYVYLFQDNALPQGEGFGWNPHMSTRLGQFRLIVRRRGPLYAYTHITGCLYRPSSCQGPWSDEDIQTFLKASRDEPHYLTFLFAIYTGMRRGEIVGLKWSDIDFSRSVIQVNASLAYNPEDEKFETTNSYTSICIE